MDKRIKVLHLTSDSKIAGVENLLLSIAEKFNRQEFEMLFCTLSKAGRLHEEIRKYSCSAFSLSNRNIYKTKDIYCSSPMILYKLVRLLRKEKIDILHTHLVWASMLGQIAAKIARVPISVMTRHYSNYTHLYGNRFAKLTDRLSALLADSIVAVSAAVAKVLVNLDNINPDKIEVIHNGLDLSKFLIGKTVSNIRKEFSIEEGAKIIAAISNLHFYKGHKYLLESVKIVIRTHPEAKFLIVGDGILEEELRRLAYNLGVENNVIFAGYRMDVPSILSQIDIFVHPTLIEGFGISIIEAMAMQRPVVATNVGGIPEIVRDRVNGVLVPSKNPQFLAKAIIELLERPGYAEELGQVARRMVEERFAVDTMVKGYEQLYQKLQTDKGLN